LVPESVMPYLHLLRLSVILSEEGVLLNQSQV